MIEKWLKLLLKKIRLIKELVSLRIKRWVWKVFELYEWELENLKIWINKYPNYPYNYAFANGWYNKIYKDISKAEKEGKAMKMWGKGSWKNKFIRMKKNEIMRRFERMWRVKEKKKPWVYEYKSPDGKWKINYRTIGNKKNKEKVERAGYKVEATLEVIDVIKKKLDEKPYKKEVKFILLKE